MSKPADKPEVVQLPAETPIAAPVHNRRVAAQRVRDYAASGKHLGPLPAPGVYARHNAVDTPALLPDGTPLDASVSRVLAARGTLHRMPASLEAEAAGTPGEGDTQ
jgi:hypothetical protein